MDYMNELEMLVGNFLEKNPKAFIHQIRIPFEKVKMNVKGVVLINGGHFSCNTIVDLKDYEFIIGFGE